MNKIVCFMFTVLLFTSCSKVNVIDETNEVENKDTIPFEVIPRDTITDSIIMYPDAFKQKKYPLN